MTVTLRVVADQLVTPTSADLAVASGELLSALIARAPRGCEVAAIVPSGEEHLESALAGLREVQPLALGRRELATSWNLGIAGTVGGGLIHSPTLLAPLVRHDRVNRGDQTVVTVWDLDAWERPHELSKSNVLWTKNMMKRAVKHADAVVVSSFALAERLRATHKFGERLRVIAGAAPAGFAVPSDSVARCRDAKLPENFVVVPYEGSGFDDLSVALVGAAGGVNSDRDVVIFGVPEGQDSAVTELAVAAGIPERHVRILGELDAADRAAVLAQADAAVFASTSSSWPWRIVEALRLGVPIVAVESNLHREVIGDAGLITSAADMRDAVAGAVDEENDRLRVLSSDRGRAYSWHSAAEQVWQLHAEL